MGGFNNVQIPPYNPAVNARNNVTAVQPQGETGQTHGQPPTGTITAKAQPKTDAEAETSLKEMNKSFDERTEAWAKYAGVEYKAPQNHQDRVALADEINQALAKGNPQEQQRFLSEMKAIGEPLGVNFGLRDKGGAALNDDVELQAPAAKIQAKLAEPYNKSSTVQPQSNTNAPKNAPTGNNTDNTNNPSTTNPPTTTPNSVVPTPGSVQPTKTNYFTPNLPNTDLTKPTTVAPIKVES
jgi:hypothetical protein